MQSRITDHLVLEALEMAIRRRGVTPGLIVQSDHGGQYTRARIQSKLEAGQPVAGTETTGDYIAAVGSIFSRRKRGW